MSSQLTSPSVYTCSHEACQISLLRAALLHEEHWLRSCLMAKSTHLEQVLKQRVGEQGGGQDWTSEASLGIIWQRYYSAFSCSFWLSLHTVIAKLYKVNGVTCKTLHWMFWPLLKSLCCYSSRGLARTVSLQCLQRRLFQATIALDSQQCQGVSHPKKTIRRFTT